MMEGEEGLGWGSRDGVGYEGGYSKNIKRVAF